MKLQPQLKAQRHAASVEHQKRRCGGTAPQGLNRSAMHVACGCNAPKIVHAHMEPPVSTSSMPASISTRPASLQISFPARPLAARKLPLSQLARHLKSGFLRKTLPRAVLTR
jgi:hypothetical protein